MPAQRCPHCGLVNPARAMVCDCGYSFVFEEAPKAAAGTPWFDRQTRGTKRLIARIIVAVFFGSFLVAIKLCGT